MKSLKEVKFNNFDGYAWHDLCLNTSFAVRMDAAYRMRDGGLITYLGNYSDSVVYSWIEHPLL